MVCLGKFYLSLPSLGIQSKSLKHLESHFFKPQDYMHMYDFNVTHV